MQARRSAPRRLAPARSAPWSSCRACRRLRVPWAMALKPLVGVGYRRAQLGERGGRGARDVAMTACVGVVIGSSGEGRAALGRRPTARSLTGPDCTQQGRGRTTQRGVLRARGRLQPSMRIGARSSRRPRSRAARRGRLRRAAVAGLAWCRRSSALEVGEVGAAAIRRVEVLRDRREAAARTARCSAANGLRGTAFSSCKSPRHWTRRRRPLGERVDLRPRHARDLRQRRVHRRDGHVVQRLRPGRRRSTRGQRDRVALP